MIHERSRSSGGPESGAASASEPGRPGPAAAAAGGGTVTGELAAGLGERCTGCYAECQFEPVTVTVSFPPASVIQLCVYGLKVVLHV